MRNFFISINYKSNDVTIENLYKSIKNTYNSKFIIIDNSCDGSALELLRTLNHLGRASIVDLSAADLCVFDNLDIALVIADKNLGFAHANNLALSYLSRKAQSDDKVILLNNDANVVSGFNFIEDFHLDNKIIGATLVRDTGLIQTLGGTDKLTKFDYGKNIEEGKKLENISVNPFTIEGYINGAFMMMTIATLNKIGLMDESYFMWCEEVDWCINAKMKGVELICNPKIIINHSIGGSSDKDIIVRRFGRISTRNSYPRFVIRGYYHFRNSFLIVKKHYPESIYIYYGIMAVSLIKRLIGVWLYDDKKLSRTKVLLLGCWHGITGKKGKVL
jgi:GT2 family glycosyltransferase